MPMPIPRPSESLKDFVSRFMADPEMVREYPDTKQRAAVANSTYERKNELKLDIAELKNVEIMSTGEFFPANAKGSVEIKEADLDQIIENFNKGIREPVLNIDHDDRFTDKIKKALRVVSLGFVSNLYKAGDKLIANFKEVPAKIAELIEKGALKKRSVEWFPKYAVDGGTIDNVLSAVSFFGADAPAIHNLSNEFEVIYDVLMQIDDYKTRNDETRPEKIIFSEEKTMKIEIDKTEYEGLIALKGKAENYETLKRDFDKVKSESEAEISDLKEKNSTLENEKAELSKFKEKAEKKAEADLEKEAEDFIDKKIEESKIPSKYKDRYVSDYLRLAASEGDALEDFKQEIEDRPSSGITEDKKTGKLIQKHTQTKGGESGPLEMKKSGLKFKDENEMNAYIEEQAKANGTSWEEEAEKVGAIDKTEVQ